MKKAWKWPGFVVASLAFWAVLRVMPIEPTLTILRIVVPIGIASLATLFLALWIRSGRRKGGRA